MSGKCHRFRDGRGRRRIQPAEVCESRFVERLPGRLAESLREHNGRHRPEERIRLRMALRAGEVTYDDHGVTASAINLAFRLIEAKPVRCALDGSPASLALVVSSWFFDEVVWQSIVADPANYRQVPVVVKETSTTGWVHLPGDPEWSRPK